MFVCMHRTYTKYKLTLDCGLKILSIATSVMSIKLQFYIFHFKFDTINSLNSLIPARMKYWCLYSLEFETTRTCRIFFNWHKICRTVTGIYWLMWLIVMMPYGIMHINIKFTCKGSNNQHFWPCNYISFLTGNSSPTECTDSHILSTWHSPLLYLYLFLFIDKQNVSVSHKTRFTTTQ